MSSEPMAVLFSFDPVTGESTADPLVGLHSSGDDPITWAFALKDSIEGDFPGRLWSVTGNDEAQELRQAYLVDSVLGPGANERIKAYDRA
jgi:hypothetical protein